MCVCVKDLHTLKPLKIKGELFKAGAEGNSCDSFSFGEKLLSWSRSMTRSISKLD